MDFDQSTHNPSQPTTTDTQDQQHHPPLPPATQPLAAPQTSINESQIKLPSTTQITQLNVEDIRRHHRELEVDNTVAAQEEADYEDEDDEETAKQTTAPAEESNQNTEEVQKTWQNVGHGQYRKVEKPLASKDEELNDEAAGLIEALTAQEPSYPSRLDEIIILSEVTSSTAWGALSIRVEDLDLLMRKRQLALHLFLQKPTAALDESRYTLYLAALLTDLFQHLDTQSFSPALAPIFADFKFWEL